MAIKEGVLEIPDSEDEPLSSSPTNELNVVIDGQRTEAPIPPALDSTSDISDALRRDDGSPQVYNDVINNDPNPKPDQAVDLHSVPTIVDVPKMNETDIAKSIPSDQDRTIAGTDEMHSIDSKEMLVPELPETNDQFQSEESRKVALLHPALDDLPPRPISERTPKTSECITKSGSDREGLLPSSIVQIPSTNKMVDLSTLDNKSRHETVQSEDQVQEQTRHPNLETESRIISSSRAASLDVTEPVEALCIVTSEPHHAEKAHEPMINDKISVTTGEGVDESADMQSHGVQSLDHSGGEEPFASHDTDEKAFGSPAAISPDPRVPEVKPENATSQSMEDGTGHPTADLNCRYHIGLEMNTSGQMEAEPGLHHNALHTKNMKATPQSENSSKLTHDHVQPDSEVADRTCENQDGDSSVQAVLPKSQEVPKPSIVANLAPKQSKSPTNTQFKKVSSASACSSSAKSSPGVTLAELKAQKAALLMSLAALPAVQVLIEETAAAQEDLADHHDEPSETDIVVAANKIVKDHIKLLHEYNELKDIGQGLMGMIADQRGVRIMEVQDEFGIDAND